MIPPVLTMAIAWLLALGDALLAFLALVVPILCGASLAWLHGDDGRLFMLGITCAVLHPLLAGEGHGGAIRWHLAQARHRWRKMRELSLGAEACAEPEDLDEDLEDTDPRAGLHDVAHARVLRVRDVCPEPGARSEDEGPGSGEAFLRDHLMPAYRTAVACDGALVVDLDGCPGFASSWLNAAFGGLARLVDKHDVAERLLVQCMDEPHLVVDVYAIVNNTRSWFVGRAPNAGERERLRLLRSHGVRPGGDDVELTPIPRRRGDPPLPH